MYFLIQKRFCVEHKEVKLCRIKPFFHENYMVSCIFGRWSYQKYTIPCNSRGKAILPDPFLFFVPHTKNDSRKKYMGHCIFERGADKNTMNNGFFDTKAFLRMTQESEIVSGEIVFSRKLLGIMYFWPMVIPKIHDTL